MDVEILEEAQTLWREHDAVDKFRTATGHFPVESVKGIQARYQNLDDQLVGSDVPTTTAELWESELKRQVRARMISIDHELSGNPWTFDDVTRYFGITPEDMDLRKWLLDHREEAIRAVNEAFQYTQHNEFEFSPALDVPSDRSTAIGFAEAMVRNYSFALARMLEQFSGVGRRFKEIRPLVNLSGRSYFWTDRNTLCIGVTGAVYQNSEGNFRPRSRNLTSLMGHEGEGHGVHHLLSSGDELPFFTRGTGWETAGTAEAIAQHFQKQIFLDLQRSPEIQKELGLETGFTGIFNEEMLLEAADKYDRRFFNYGIGILADTSFNEVDSAGSRASRRESAANARIEELEPLELYPGQARSLIERHQRSYLVGGELDSRISMEIRYASGVVGEVIRRFAKAGLDYNKMEDRTRIERVMMTGEMTPRGLLDKVDMEIRRINNERLEAEKRPLLLPGTVAR